MMGIRDGELGVVILILQPAVSLQFPLSTPSKQAPRKSWEVQGSDHTRYQAPLVQPSPPLAVGSAQGSRHRVRSSHQIKDVKPRDRSWRRVRCLLGRLQVRRYDYPHTNPGYTGPVGSSPTPSQPRSTQTRPQPSRTPEDPVRQARLLQRAREAFNNARDRELQQLLAERYHAVPASARPSLEEVLRMAARFLEIANLRLEARLALIYLANAGWEFESAVGRYWGERYDDEEEEEEEEEGDGGSGSESESSDEGDVSYPLPPPKSHSPTHPANRSPKTAPTTPRSLLRAANPTISRSPARKSHPDPSKTTITLTNLPGKSPIERTYPHPVDWSSSASIRGLNRWRQQTLRRLLGRAREERIRLHEEENGWLVRVHREHERRGVDWGASGETAEGDEGRNEGEG
ncbi:hypothetical protein G7Y79_00020g048570 [Physcia stellaris]|nr:hypothetical protein G7Y79_00020g048570 [Physcia stellaris]